MSDHFVLKDLGLCSPSLMSTVDRPWLEDVRDVRSARRPALLTSGSVGCPSERCPSYTNTPRRSPHATARRIPSPVCSFIREWELFEAAYLHAGLQTSDTRGSRRLSDGYDRAHEDG